MGFELKKLVNLYLIESGLNQRRKLFLGGFIVKITQNFRVCLAIFISGYFLGAAGVPVDSQTFVSNPAVLVSIMTVLYRAYFFICHVGS